mgnify:CR=1 FL=1
MHERVYKISLSYYNVRINKLIKIGLISSIAIALIMAVYFIKEKKISGCAIDENNIDEFAKYLTSKGIRMYGSAFCPHCNKQKEIFGESFKYIDYVECTENEDLCRSLIGVPAWKINGKIYYGTKSLSELKELSC